MPQPDRLLNTLRQAARAFRQTPHRVGRLVRLPAGAEVLVAGGMHGSVGHFCPLLRPAHLDICSANRGWHSHSLPSSRRVGTFDPADLERYEPRPEDLELGCSVHALVWGRDVSESNAVDFLARVDADLLITGHIPCEE